MVQHKCKCIALSKAFFKILKVLLFQAGLQQSYIIVKRRNLCCDVALQRELGDDFRWYAPEHVFFCDSSLDQFQDGSDIKE